MVGPSQSVRFRPILAKDVEPLKNLYKECFPVKYPDSWFADLITNPALISFIVISGEDVVGVLVAKFLKLSECGLEDRKMLDLRFPPETCVAYILSLCVTESYRSKGIASRLLNGFIHYASGSHYTQRNQSYPPPRAACAPYWSEPDGGFSIPNGYSKELHDFSQVMVTGSSGRPSHDCAAYHSLLEVIDLLPPFPPVCHAIYLHVLRTNFTARRFYEHRGFRSLHIQRGCYSIGGRPADGCTYVLYVNGGFAGEPPLSPPMSRMLEYFQYTWLPTPIIWFFQMIIRLSYTIMYKISPPTFSEPSSRQH
ncbi:unnamed protein product [Calicophoron daubneyi]|uniref:N-alpha-acetyltransferase 60 n=1 Tax=Calicophoron daubneyi TaxID=300641 RepID=A0AAV2T2P7_CALDB